VKAPNLWISVCSREGSTRVSHHSLQLSANCGIWDSWISSLLSSHFLPSCFQELSFCGQGLCCNQELPQHVQDTALIWHSPLHPRSSFSLLPGHSVPPLLTPVSQFTLLLISHLFETALSYLCLTTGFCSALSKQSCFLHASRTRHSFK